MNKFEACKSCLLIHICKDKCDKVYKRIPIKVSLHMIKNKVCCNCGDSIERIYLGSNSSIGEGLENYLVCDSCNSYFALKIYIKYHFTIKPINKDKHELTFKLHNSWDHFLNHLDHKVKLIKKSMNINTIYHFGYDTQQANDLIMNIRKYQDVQTQSSIYTTKELKRHA